MHPYSSIDTTAAWKKLRFILSVRSDFHMIDNLSIAVHAFVSRVSMSFSVDETLLPRSSAESSFFQAAAVSILLYGCTTWKLIKCMDEKLDDSYTRMLRVILKKPCRHHPKKQQLYGHLPAITKTIQVRWTRHAGQCWRSKRCTPVDPLTNSLNLQTAALCR